MIQRITKKHTQKQVRDAGGRTTVLSNVMTSDEMLEWCMTEWTDVLAELGKPLVHMYDYESCPGVWKFYDTDRGINYTLYSDAHKKSYFKGTTIEFTLDEGSKKLSDSDMRDAYKELMNFIGIKNHRRELESNF